MIEFNPRMASQFSDLYQRVHGIDLHALSLALAHGRDPATVPRSAPTAGAAASFVYRVFDAAQPATQPDAASRQAFAGQFPDGLLFCFPKPRGSMARDFKWLGSYRYGIVHLGGRDAEDLHQRCLRASSLLGWPAPYAREGLGGGHARGGGRVPVRDAAGEGASGAALLSADSH